MKKVLFMSLISMFTMFYSCKDETIEVITTSSDALTVKPLFASEVLTIDATSAWTASSSDSWCTMSDSVGTTKKVILVSCQSNLTGLPREATITVHANKQTKAILVKQAGGTILLAEDFNDDTNNWTQSSDSVTASISNGNYNMKSFTKFYSWLVGTKVLIPEYTGNYLISIDYKIISGTAPFGFTFGYKNSLNFYKLFVFQTGLIYVYQVVNGASTKLFGVNTTYYQNENIIAVLKSGDICYVYLNDHKIGSFNFTPYGSYVGFYLYPQSEVAVNHLNINQF